MEKVKPFKISKHIVMEAYKRVKANKGAAGVDRQSIEDFEINLKSNLYKLWNRMSSGSYFPPPVLEVEIPKNMGGKRKLGIPTVADRIAQMVVKIHLESKVEPKFLPDSYGYRPRKSAIQALQTARERCRKYDWAIDLDIQGFFDNLDHKLLLKAVTKHTDCKWSLLYIERWLKAPVQKPSGITESRTIGTPQGGVISPLLANLFLHYAFDKWMERNFPQNPYERYADDIVIHTKTKREAENLKRMIQARLAECNLQAHPEKTKIVYCKDSNRKDSHNEIQFTFLGYTFRPREARNKYGTNFTLFSPGVSNEAKKKMNQTMRGWKLHLRSNLSLEELAKWINPVLRGWVNYYGRFYKTALYPVFYHLNETLTRWIKRKYKKFKRKFQRAIRLLGEIAKKQPKLFAHWEFGFKPTA